MQKIKENNLDFSAENIFKLKQLMKGKKFDEEGIKESGLVEVLYLAIVDPLLKAIGITDPGVPFFVWSELGYESIMLQIGIDNFIKDIEK